MRNKKMWERVLAGTLSVTITVAAAGAMLTGCNTASTDASSDAAVETTAEASADAEQTIVNKTGTAYKSETVYATTDKSGTVNDITVSDWLQNTEHYATIADETTMDSVINVKGNEDIEQTGETLKIDAQGEDIYYQGQLDTSSKLPVSLNITYKLNGKEVTAQELEGASGKVTIRIEYVNNETVTVDGEEVYVPFMVATGMLLPTEDFSNVQVTNGKVITNGNYEVVVGYGLPGMNESLGLTGEYAQFTDYVEITADTTNYNVDTMMSFCTSSVFRDMDLEDVDDLDSLEESLNELSDASAQLVAGSAELSDGADTLNTGMKTLADGAQTLAAGMLDAQSGASKIKDGAALLSQKLAQLNSSMSTMYSTIEQSISAYNTQKSSAQTACDSYEAALDAYNQAKTAGADAVTQMSVLSQYAKALYAAGATPSDEAYSSQLTTAYATAEQCENAVTQLTSAGDTSSASYQQALQGAIGYYEGYCEGCAEYYSAAANQCEGAVKALEAIKEAMDAKDESTGYNLQESLGKLEEAGNTLASGTADLYTGISDAVTGSGTLASGAVQLSTGAKQLAEGAQELEDGMAQFDEEGIQKLVEAFDGDLGSLVSNLKSVVDAGKEYKTFTALTDGGDGEVKFIIKTE